MAPVGVWFLVIGDPGPIRRFMGIVVLVFAVLMMFGWRNRGVRNRGASILSGAISGFLNGFARLAGTWLSLYFLSDSEELAHTGRGFEESVARIRVMTLDRLSQDLDSRIEAAAGDGIRPCLS